MATELFSEPVMTGGANTNDWIVSMREMSLLYADGSVTEKSSQSENALRREDFNRLLNAAAKTRRQGD
jgi:hypothetical protein